MAIRKHGSARWSGGLRDGKGFVSTETGVLNDQPYGFATRFEDKKGTNPEELIGAAHASCFAMALSGQLGERDITADEITAKSTITLEQGQDGFSVTRAHLDVSINAPGADQGKLSEAAEAAKKGCPISRLLKAEVTMELSVS